MEITTKEQAKKFLDEHPTSCKILAGGKMKCDVSDDQAKALAMLEPVTDVEFHVQSKTVTGD